MADEFDKDFLKKKHGEDMKTSLIFVIRMMMRYKMLEAFTPNDQTASSGLRSTSWTPRTSLDKITHLSALKYLIPMPEIAEFPPTLTVGCFYIFIRCLYLQTREPAITRELEQLATLSVKSLVRTVITSQSQTQLRVP